VEVYNEISVSLKAEGLRFGLHNHWWEFEQTASGEGTIDFPGIVKAGGKNIEGMIVEFDEYDHDIFEGVQKSYNYLTKNGLAKGKI